MDSSFILSAIMENHKLWDFYIVKEVPFLLDFKSKLENRDFLLTCVNIYGNILDYAPEELRNDREIKIEALQNWVKQDTSVRTDEILASIKRKR